MLKSAALVPVMAGEFVRVTLDAVPLLSVAVMGEQIPKVVDGNTTGLGEKAKTVLPVPVNIDIDGAPSWSGVGNLQLPGTRARSLRK